MAERRRSHSEEESLADLTATQVSPRTARVMTWAFVALIAGVPLLQTAFEAGRGQTPQVLRLFVPLKEGFARLTAGQWRNAVGAVLPLLSAHHLHAWEKQIEKGALGHRLVQPRLQALLTARGKCGNEKCLIGREGWLYYQPGIDYLTGGDLLDPERLRVQARKLADREGIRDPHPDPRPAILRLHADCARAGVHLVVVPVPDKAMLEPAHLLRRGAPLVLPNNPGYVRLVRELREQGVDVFEPVQESADHGEPLYLRQDTHWTPDFMERTAARLADHLRRAVALPPPARPLETAVLERCVARHGDLVDMLGLPRGQTLFPPESILIRQILDVKTGHPWQSDPMADVLLLGDSFTNIYSDGEGKEGLGWGRSAGFAAHLARRLDRPLDVIARNGSGATGVRIELARRPDPLGGKRILVWEFAARDLALADWKPVPLSGRRARPVGRGRGGVATSERLVIEGTILAVSRVPAPYTVPYKDCLTYVKVRVDRVAAGAFTGDQLIAAFWGLRDNRPQPAATYRPGDRFRLTLVPLLQVSGQLATVRAADDLDDYEHPTFYVQEEHGL